MRLRVTFAAALGGALLTVSSQAQSLRSAQSVWSSEASEVPALAQRVDAMLLSGDLVASRVQRDSQFPNRSHERLNQLYRGVPVFGGQLVWQKRSGEVLSITGKLFDDIEVDVEPTVLKDEAATNAINSLGGKGGLVGRSELVVLPLRGRFALAYRFHVRGEATLHAVFVDAHDGTIALSYNDLRTQTQVGLGVGTWSDEKKMTIQEAAGTFRAVDTIRPYGIRTFDVGFNFNSWNTYQASTDAFLATDADNEWRDGAVVDAHAYAGYTYDYYFKRHGRNGLDDRGLVAISFVHILPRSAGFNNAFFDPVDNSMNYGDGDGVTFTFFSASLDVVAHELTHAVTNSSSDLIYLNESGALNESISDIMGASVEFEFEQAGDGRQQADWFLGEDLFVNFGGVFRSFANPLNVNDPDHYSVRCLPPVCSEDFDNGGVHINSSIINHAFYLMVEGGRNRTSGISVQGIGRAQMERMESIFYRAFFFFLVPSSTIADARQATLRAARELYGSGSVEVTTVENGWRAVGVR